MLVLINLDTAWARRENMARQLRAQNLGFTRVGVDLRGASAEFVRAQVARFPGLSFDARRLSPAEIGCWLSHLVAWQHLLGSADDACTVIEDDLTLDAGFAEAHEVLSRRGDFDIVYLGTSSRNISQRQRHEVGGLMVHRPLGVIYNTWGYSIGRDYAQRFFAALPREIALPIDHVLGGRARLARPRIGVLQPAVVAEDPVLGAASQIGPYTRRIDRSRLLQNMRRRLLASPASEIYYSLYRYL